MEVSKNGLDLIKEYEGCYLKAYKDPVGVWTIGYGITNADKHITGVTITRGVTISKATAERWLEAALNEKYTPLVMKYYKRYSFNQNEFDALVSFCYNIGSIDQLTNYGARSKREIADKMLEYNKAGGNILRGLTRRRTAERKLFLTPVESSYKGYSGLYPALPTRGYYKLGDGISTLRDYPTQIKRVQEVLNWALDLALDVDGKFGKNTETAVRQLQKRHGLTVDGYFGAKCLAAVYSITK